VSDLILLCSGAAADGTSAAHDPSSSDAALEPGAIAAALAGGAIARACVRAGVAADATDDALVPRELPCDAWLRERFGVAPGDAIEAWSAPVHGVAPPCWRLTPVNVRVGHDSLVLDDPGALALGAGEARALAAAAAPLFAEAGLALTAPAPLAWFATGDTTQRWQARPWTLACGRRIDAFLPGGEDARAWRRLFTEVQMLWHAHPVTSAREAAGRAPVNALWLDGRATALARDGTRAPRAVVTGEPAVAGLARAAGARAFDADPLALDDTAWRALARDGDVLLDVGVWRSPRRGADASAWHEAWRAADAWYAALCARRDPLADFARVRWVFTGERRRVELALARSERWQPWRHLDALARVLGTSGVRRR